MKLSDALTCVFKNPRWENVPSCISSASKIRRPNISCSSKRKWVCFCSKQGLSKWVEKMPLQAIFKNTRQRMWPERSQLTGRGRRVRQTRAKEASATALPGAGGLNTEHQSTGKGGPASRGRSRPGCSSWRGKGGCRGPPCSSGPSSVTPALIQHVAFTNLGQTQAPWSRGFLHNLVLERQVRGGGRRLLLFSAWLRGGGLRRTAGSRVRPDFPRELPATVPVGGFTDPWSRRGPVFKGHTYFCFPTWPQEGSLG